MVNKIVWTYPVLKAKVFCKNWCFRGSYVSALNKTWCPEHFVCHERSCGQNLLNSGFVEKDGALYCEKDYEQRFAPTCAKCGNTIKEVQKINHALYNKNNT